MITDQEELGGYDHLYRLKILDPPPKKKTLKTKQKYSLEVTVWPGVIDTLLYSMVTFFYSK